MSGTVGVAYYRSLEGEFLADLDALELPPDWWLLRREGSHVDDQRNFLVENFKGDWLLQIDNDQAFMPQALNRLLESGKDIIGACYYRRGKKFDPLVLRYNGKYNDAHQYKPMSQEIIDYLKAHRAELNGEPTVLLKEPHLVECDAIGTGFLLVHRRVFEKLTQPYFSYREGGSEDMYFCRKAKASGFKIYADLSVQLGHYAKIPVGYPHFLARIGAIK